MERKEIGDANHGFSWPGQFLIGFDLIGSEEMMNVENCMTFDDLFCCD